MSFQSRRGRAMDTTDSIGERGLSHPVQTSEDTDVKPFAFSKTQNVDLSSLDSGISSMRINSMEPPTSNSAYCSTDIEHTYNMNHPRRGTFVIINNRHFDKSTGRVERSGTDVDAANLFTAFKQLGFQVDLQSNLTREQMLKLILKYAGENHRDCDCFALAILTHGEEGLIYGKDGAMEVKKLIEPLKDCESLRGKPKLFIIQACRGTQFDEGVDVTDAEVFSPAKPVLYRLPKEADFLYVYSTSPGFQSFRNPTKGSVFVTALAKVVREHGSKMEVCRLMTYVHHEVAIGFESYCRDAAQNRKKQAPSFESMLTKDLYFPQKR